MKRIAAGLLCLALCGSLCGCTNLFDGHYSSVTPHENPGQEAENQAVSAGNYTQLYDAVRSFVEQGRTEGVIGVSDYIPGLLKLDMERIVSEICRINPVAVYAVESIRYEQGKSAGQMVVNLNITYNRDPAQLRDIQTVSGMEEAEAKVRLALDEIRTGLVLRVKQYEAVDFVEMVNRYAMECPQLVMEQPQITVKTYPENSSDRVVELRFTYQTGRDSLRNMRAQVEPVFESALLYVSGDGSAAEKYAQLYSFLMERYDYQIVSSITPAYSLLRHGVGDSKAFACVYAAMCRQAGLECMVVSGTCDGESRYWTIIGQDGAYFHVDLMEDRFIRRSDGNMVGYVWDYSAYPPCGIRLAE
jgi:hypothetical protein